MNTPPSPRPSKRRLRKSVWLPIVVLIYAIAITAFNARPWIESGHTMRLVLSCLFELALVGGLFWALRRKETLSRKETL